MKKLICLFLLFFMFLLNIFADDRKPNIGYVELKGGDIHVFGDQIGGYGFIDGKWDAKDIKFKKFVGTDFVMFENTDTINNGQFELNGKSREDSNEYVDEYVAKTDEEKEAVYLSKFAYSKIDDYNFFFHINNRDFQKPLKVFLNNVELASTNIRDKGSTIYLKYVFPTDTTTVSLSVEYDGKKLNGLIVDVNPGSKFTGVSSNKIYLDKPLKTYITSAGDYDMGEFAKIIKFKNRPLGLDASVLVNGVQIPVSNLNDSLGQINFNYANDKLDKFLRVQTGIGNKRLNTIYIENKSIYLGEYRILKIERVDQVVRVFIRGDEIGGVNLFLNGKQLVKGQDYSYNGTDYVIGIPLVKLTPKNEVVLKTDTQKSQRLFFEIGEKLYTPTIDTLQLPKGNTLGSTNKLYGEAVYGGLNANYKLVINNKTFTAFRQSYEDWYSKESTKLNTELKQILARREAAKRIDDVNEVQKTWGEEEKVNQNIEKIKEDAYNYVFDFELVSDRFQFTQPVFYKTGSENNIYLIVEGKKSNIISFTAKDTNNNQSYEKSFEDEKLLSELYGNFKPAAESTSTIYQNNQYILGNLSLMSGNNSDYYISEIKFDLKQKDNTGYLPLQYVMLGKVQGAVRDLGNNNYELVFEDILLRNLTTTNYDLIVKLSDNFEHFRFEAYPTQIVFKQLDYRNSNKLITEKLFYEGKSYFEVKYTYSPCFDLDIKYTNCKANGYIDKSRYTYSISQGGGSILLDKTSNQDGADDSSKDVVVQNEIQQKINKIKIAIDEFVHKKSKGNIQVKIDYYQLFYKALGQVYKKTSSLNKKKLIRGLAILIKDEYKYLETQLLE